MKETNIRSVVFLEADILSPLLGVKIKHPDMHLEDIEKLFKERNGVIKREEIEKTVPDIQTLGLEF